MIKNVLAASGGGLEAVLDPVHDTPGNGGDPPVAVLALEDFAPTTNFPALAEAQVLLNTLGS